MIPDKCAVHAGRCSNAVTTSQIFDFILFCHLAEVIKEICSECSSLPLIIGGCRGRFSFSFKYLHEIIGEKGFLLSTNLP